MRSWKHNLKGPVLAGAVLGLLYSATLLAGTGKPSHLIKSWIESGKLKQVEQFIADSSHRSIQEAEVVEIFALLRDRGLSDLALRWLQNQYRAHSESEKIARILAEYLIEQDRAKEAVPIYQQLAQRRPQERNLWLRLGELALWTNQQELAIQAYERAVQLDSSDVQTMKQLRDLYLWNNRIEKAYTLEKQWVRRQPDNADLYLDLATHARWLNRLAESNEALKRYLRRQPGDENAWLMLGENYLWSEQPHLAEKVFRYIVKRWPQNQKAKYYLAQIQQWQPFGWWEAKTLYRQILQQQPNHAEARAGLRRLEKEHGPRFEGTYYYIVDSNRLSRTVMQVYHTRYLGPRLTLQAKGGYRRLTEWKKGVHLQAEGYGMHLSGTYHLTTAGRLRFEAGGVQFDGGRSFWNIDMQWQQTWFQRLYTTTFYRRDQVEDGVLGVLRHTFAHRLGQEMYLQFSRGFIAASVQHSRYSDQNRKWQFYFHSEWLIFPEPVRWYLFLIYSYDDMSIIFPDAYPYWTPERFWSRSPGILAELKKTGSWRLRIFYALTQQPGNELANNYGAEFRWAVTPLSDLRLFYQKYGSKYYAYKTVQAGFTLVW